MSRGKMGVVAQFLPERSGGLEWKYADGLHTQPATHSLGGLRHLSTDTARPKFSGDTKRADPHFSRIKMASHVNLCFFNICRHSIADVSNPDMTVMRIDVKKIVFGKIACSTLKGRPDK